MGIIEKSLGLLKGMKSGNSDTSNLGKSNNTQEDKIKHDTQMLKSSITWLKYDVAKMKKHKSFPKSYYLGTEEQSHFKEDMLEIQNVINSSELTKKVINGISLTTNNIEFKNDDNRLEYTEFTPTGKKPKFPYRIICFAKRGNQFLFGIVVDYDEEQNIGKFKYTFSKGYTSYDIYGKIDNGSLVVHKVTKDGKKL